MIQFIAFSEQLRRSNPVAYFSDPNSAIEQLSACLLFKGKLKDSSKELPTLIYQLNSKIKSDLLKYLTQHMIQDSIQIMLVDKDDNLEFPYAVVENNESDYDALIRYFKKEYDISLLSNNDKDVLSVLLGKYNRNIDCQTVQKFNSVYISCHAFLILENQKELQIQNQKVKWIQLKDMLNYDSLRVMKTQNPDSIKQILRHRSFVSDAAKRKAKNVQFTVLMIDNKKLKGIFLQLWLYAIQVTIAGSLSKYHKKILSDYVKKAQQFDINFRWYHPFGFLMKHNAQKNYQIQMSRFQYIEKQNPFVTRQLIVAGSVIAIVAGGIIGYKKWKSIQ